VPHIIIEHSKGVSAQININELANAFHVLAKDIEALPEGGIRTRVYEADISLIGDGKSDRNFIYITVRLGQGRILKQQISKSRYVRRVVTWPAFEKSL